MNRLLIFGDSITWGAWDNEGGWATRLKKYTDKQAIQNGFENYNTVYPMGISGENTDKLLNRFKTELTSRLDEESNEVVIIAIGTNDSQFNVDTEENKVPLSKFEENLNTFIKISQNNNIKDICFIGLTPVDDSLMNPMPWKPTHGYSNKHINKYDNVIKKIARTNSLSYISLFKHFMTNGSKQLLSDGVHPNTQGHKFMYQTILKGLQKNNILD